MVNVIKYTNCRLMNLIKICMLKIILSNMLALGLSEISFAAKAVNIPSKITIYKIYYILLSFWSELRYEGLLKVRSRQYNCYKSSL
jgi:predicted acetyltransferase